MKVEVMTAAAMAQGLAEGVQWACAAEDAAGAVVVLTRAVRWGAWLFWTETLPTNSLRLKAAASGRR